ncbi:nucleoporin Nup37 isoform X1 [Agrilus planipennis]|uniref:Nucleoporin Nup37 isoform X1 n=1 Tax=Agrilus planipennis TaxID=224129 RepID=A0A1W4WXA1_AGRPL|nr:nucleoporin Nup37 isoform X1 [Agrilus planipennis]
MSPIETTKPNLINKDANLSFVVELSEQISTIAFSNSELSQDLILIAFPREISVAQLDSQEPYELKELIKFNHGVQCTALSLSPITTIYGVPKILVFCAAGNDFKLRIFESDISQKDTTKVINAHSDYINDVAFDPDNNYLVSASDDNTAKLWSTEDYHCLYTFKLKSPGISCCWHKDDNSKLMLAEKMGVIRFYNVNTQKPILSVDYNKPIAAAHWAPSDPQIVGCLQHGELVIWDLTRASRPLYTKLLFADSGNSIKFSPFGELVATMSQLEGTLKVTNVQSQHQRLSAQISLASNISWHFRLPFVCVGVDNNLMFWKVT